MEIAHRHKEGDGSRDAINEIGGVKAFERFLACSSLLDVLATLFFSSLMLSGLFSKFFSFCYLLSFFLGRFGATDDAMTA